MDTKFSDLRLNVKPLRFREIRVSDLFDEGLGARSKRARNIDRFNKRDNRRDDVYRTVELPSVPLPSGQRGGEGNNPTCQAYPS
jgi:hypothetical protein